MRIFIAELIGTAFIILFGSGSVAMITLFQPANTFGGYTNVVFGWALGVAFAVVISMRISGAHLNPAVTLALATTKRFAWSQVPMYILAQVIGAFVGAAIVFAVFYAQWIQFDPALSHTTGIFATFPAVPRFLPGFIDQVVGTFILLYLILAVGNFIKNPTENIAFPILIGAIVLGIGISFGGMNGYAINPARDLGPRLLALMMGFDNTGFAEYYIWTVPIIGPLVGGVLGAYVFDLTIKEK